MSINSKESSLRLICFVPSMQNNRGFTLVELIVVMAIIGVLASISLPRVYEFRYKTRVARAAAEIRGIEKEIFSYASEKGVFPTNLSNINMQDMKDPWGNNYVYNPVCTRAVGSDKINTDFDLYSMGLDGETDPSIVNDKSLDDIIRGKEGSFDDLASRFL